MHADSGRDSLDAYTGIDERMMGAGHMRRKNHEGYNDPTPFEAFQRIYNITLDKEEMGILLEALYWKGNEVSPDSGAARQLYHKIQKLKKEKEAPR